MEISNTVREAIDGFKLHGELKECIRYGSGHINDTYRLTYETSQGTKRYILQRMSRNIFKKPIELMENISGVTSWLRKKIIENGGDPERETLTLVKSQTGLPYFVDSDGEYWRVYLFIEGATCYDAVKDDNDFYQSAVAFGHFQQIIRQRHFMRRSRISITHRTALRNSRKLLQRMSVEELPLSRKKLILSWREKN